MVIEQGFECAPVNAGMRPDEAGLGGVPTSLYDGWEMMIKCDHVTTICEKGLHK